YYIPPGGYAPGGCEKDSDCGGDVCARDGECLAPSEVMSIHISWTVNGQAPSDAACANGPDWFVDFSDGFSGGGFGFAPVPCKAGVFSVDKLPNRYVDVDLGVDGAQTLGSGTFDAEGRVSFDVSL